MEFLKKLALDTKIGKINLNWPAGLAFGIFWSYGFFGAVGFKNPVLQIGSSLFFLGLFLYFLKLADKKNLGEYAVTFSRRELAAALSFLIIFLLLSWPNLQAPLSGDQFYHTEHSQTFGIAFISKLSAAAPVLNNFSFGRLLYIFNIGLLLAAIIFYLLLRRRNWVFRAAVYSGIFLILRAVVFLAGGNNDPHPPLRLLPLWLASAIFSPSGPAFRLATLLGLTLLVWLLYKKFSEKFPHFLAWLLALTAGTLPVLWHVSVIIEHSLWAAFAWTLLVLMILDYDPEQPANWFTWFAFVSLFGLMRQTVIIACLPLGLIFLWSEWKRKQAQKLWQFTKLRYKYWLLCLSPLLLVLPFFIRSLIVGTPASYIPGEVDFIAAHSGALQRVWYAFHSGRVWSAGFNSIFIYGVIFLIFGFIPLKKSRKLQSLILIVFFIVALSSFYTIRPPLWGLGKYAAEYAVPFIAAGLYGLIAFLISRQMFLGKAAAYILLLMVLITNIYIFKNINRLNPPADESMNTKTPAFIVQSEWSYNYDRALAEARRQNLDGSVYIAGTSYGIFPEILSGFSVAKILAESRSYQALLNQKQITAQAINSQSGIKLILVSDLVPQEKQNLILQLGTLGWRPWQNFYNPDYGSTIVGLIR